MIDLKRKEEADIDVNAMPKYPTVHVCDNEAIEDVKVNDHFKATLVVTSVTKSERNEEGKVETGASVTFEVRDLEPSGVKEKPKEMKSDRKDDEDEFSKTVDEVLSEKED